MDFKFIMGKFILINIKILNSLENHMLDEMKLCCFHTLFLFLTESLVWCVTWSPTTIFQLVFCLERNFKVSLIFFDTVANTQKNYL